MHAYCIGRIFVEHSEEQDAMPCLHCCRDVAECPLASIPPEIGQLTALRRMDMHSCKLHGGLPDEIG